MDETRQRAAFIFLVILVVSVAVLSYYLTREKDETVSQGMINLMSLTPRYLCILMQLKVINWLLSQTHLMMGL